MVKLTLSLLLFFAFIHSACGQDKKPKADTAAKHKRPDTPQFLKPHQLKLNLQDAGPGLSFEQRIDSVNSLYFSGGLQPHVGLGISFIGPGSSFISEYTINPYFTAGYRHYYNFKTRRKRKRSIISNSASFIALDAGYMWQATRASKFADKNTSAMLRAAWGMQRSLGKHFSYEILLGALLQHEVTQNNPYQPGLHLAPAAGIKIGYVIF